MGPTRNIEWVKPLLRQWTAELKHAMLNNLNGADTVSYYLLNGAIEILGGKVLAPENLSLDLDSTIREHLHSVERAHSKDAAIIEFDSITLEKYHGALQIIRSIIGRKKNESPANLIDLMELMKDAALLELKCFLDAFIRKHGLQENIYSILGKLACYFLVSEYWRSAPDWISIQFQVKQDSCISERKKIDGDPETVAVFIAESREIFRQISVSLDLLQKKFSQDTLQALKRDLHTLKGAARMVGLLQFGEYVHILEQIYMSATETISLPFNALQSAHQYISDMLDSIKTGYMPGSIGREISALQLAAGGISGVVETPKVENNVNLKGLLISSIEKVNALISIYTEWKKTHDDAAFSKIKAEVSALEAESLDLHVQDVSNLIENLKIALEETPQNAEEALRRVLQVFQTLDKGKLFPAAQEEAQNRKQQGGQTICVLSSEISKFSKIAGMMSVSRANLEHDLAEINNAVASLNKDILFIDRSVVEVSADFVEHTPKNARLKTVLGEIAKTMHNMSSITTHMREMLFSIDNLLIQQGQEAIELRRGLTEIQLAPFSKILPRFEGFVKDVSKSANKNVRFIAERMTSKLDREMLDRLVSPFENMLRNAIDHGIESSEQRVAAGKPEYGTIVLSGQNTGAQIVLTLEDDGQGINIEKVRKKAIDRGLLDPNAPLSEEEILRCILQPGFTTKEPSDATYISGRGVGMDAVNTEVENLAGTLLIRSVPGVGTTFTINIPFTQTSSEILLFTLDSYWYGIHAWNVENIVRAPYASVLAYLNGEAEFSFNGQPFSFRYMDALLHGEKYPAPTYKGRAMPVILLKVAETALAILVDHVVGIRKVFLKSAGPQLQHVKEIAGATIMPDGHVVLVLDAMVLEHVVLHDKKYAHQDTKRKVLVVDDSETVRKTTKEYLEARGYQVVLAKDGLEAIEAAQKNIINMVMIDVDMPKMSGYELVTAIRDIPKLKDIPIVMITSRSGEMDEQRATSAGVNAMLTKPYDERKLNAVIQQWLEK